MSVCPIWLSTVQYGSNTIKDDQSYTLIHTETQLKSLSHALALSLCLIPDVRRQPEKWRAAMFLCYALCSKRLQCFVGVYLLFFLFVLTNQHKITQNSCTAQFFTLCVLLHFAIVFDCIHLDHFQIYKYHQ